MIWILKQAQIFCLSLKDFEAQPSNLIMEPQTDTYCYPNRAARSYLF